MWTDDSWQPSWRRLVVAALTAWAAIRAAATGTGKITAVRVPTLAAAGTPAGWHVA